MLALLIESVVDFVGVRKMSKAKIPVIINGIMIDLFKAKICRFS